MGRLPTEEEADTPESKIVYDSVKYIKRYRRLSNKRRRGTISPVSL